MDDVIDDRLAAGEQLTLPYGKLMERLLTFKIIRENLNSPVFVDLSWGSEDWGWGGTPQVQEEKKEEKCDSDVVKAKFVSHLIPMAEKRLKEIRLVQ